MNAHRTRAAQLDRSVPNRTRYQAAPRPEESGTYDVTRRRSQAGRLRGPAQAVVKMFGAAFREAVREQAVGR